ncbi:hypothetical protein DFH08DRAFT_937969 [Mycena albidolilacea]|uniref:Vacuolar sorting protein 39/Transforming growth factor beta receptor-associated domain-containing protein n=1 Tax=Mycena albidolilacea TaxID=1033008 RepID=A0AAD6ZXC4_9AGAR|nr:hypothetical protein DFH08DRAFT_937969 [Mycena albidolilacea]
MLRHLTSTFPRSGILLLGNSVKSLVPSTLISQAESLLLSHRIEEAVDLADQQRRKLQGNVIVDEDEAEELRYVYQRIGFQCFTETLFEDAGKNLFNGDLDPSVLVSYYPELRGSLFSADDTLDVYAGVAERMPREASVDEIIVANLVRNYSPYLKPNTQTAPPTAELRKILGMAAVDMLELFLKKCRTRRNIEGKRKADTSYSVVDTVLAKIYAQAEKTKELYALIQQPHEIVLSEIEPVLKQTGQYNALCMLYKQTGDDENLLQVWAKLVEGEWMDEDVKDPVEDMLNLLSGSKNRILTQKWGLWLTRRDPERGIRLLMPRETGKRPHRPEDDLSLLEQIREANPAAGAQFLEYLVLQKRSSSRDLHTQLAKICVDQLLEALKNDDVSKLWRAKGSSYASSRSDSTFFHYFAKFTPDSPAKLIRLKTVLFLQGSSLYDAELIREQLVPHSKRVLSLELAIVNGKLGNHRAALSALVNDLHDSLSAEAYCTLGGDVVPGKVIQDICADPTLGLAIWASGLSSKGRQKTVDASDGLVKRKELLKTLLEVYMSDEEASAERAAHLVNSQAMNLDVTDVIPTLPPKWPLKVMSSFLARSFRRTVHARQEGRIVKAIAAGQNLDVKDRTWIILREEGMVVEEALDDDEGDGADYDEKSGVVEKIATEPEEKSSVPWTAEPDIASLHVG